jgi:hypothetical protein
LSLPQDVELDEIVIGVGMEEETPDSIAVK